MPDPITRGTLEQGAGVQSGQPNLTIEPNQLTTSEISWQKVLGTGKKPEEKLTTVLRGRSEKEKSKEVEVSSEAVEITKSSLLRALLLNSEGGSAYQDTFFAQVAKILLNEDFLKTEGMDINNIPQDIEGKINFFEKLVERFYQRFPDQAIALGVCFSAWEWQIIQQ